MGLSGGRYARQLVRKEGGCAAGGVIGDRRASVVLLAGNLGTKCEKRRERGWGWLICFIFQRRDVRKSCSTFQRAGDGAASSAFKWSSVLDWEAVI